MDESPQRTCFPDHVEYQLPSVFKGRAVAWLPTGIEFHYDRESPAPGTVIGWDESRKMFFIMQLDDLNTFKVPAPWDGTVPE